MTSTSLLLLLVPLATIALMASLILKRQDVEGFDADQFFRAANLPTSGLERYRLLQEQPDSDVLQKINEAARRKVGTTATGRFETMLRVCGYQTEEERFSLFVHYVIVSSSATVLFFTTAGFLTDWQIASLATAVFFPTVTLLWLLYLDRQRESIEHSFLLALLPVLQTLPTIMHNATDLATTLRSLLAKFPFDRESNPVLLSFDIALEQNKSGVSLQKALQSTCSATGIAPLRRLVGILILVESEGAGWSAPLAELTRAVEGSLRVERNRPRAFRAFRR